jgi:hypothetical protein
MDFSIHNKTLKHVHISYMHNPQDFMNGTWPKSVLLNFCTIYRKLNPPITNTQKLEIDQLYDHSLKNMINWNKFPKLKILYLNSFDIDFTGFENCKDLEIIYIELKKPFLLPDVISSFKNLKHLITNCSIRDNTKFISKDLKTCVNNNRGKNITFESKHEVIRSKKFYSLDLIYRNLQIDL